MVSAYRISGLRLLLVIVLGVMLMATFVVPEAYASAASAYRIDWSGAGANGWKNPLEEGAELITHPDYDFDSKNYIENHRSRHTGVDIHSPEQQPVYAIAAGKVVHVVRSDVPMKLVVIIRHEGWDDGTNQSFFAVYGHMLADDFIKKGVTVAAGQRIGEIRQAGTPSHLHFGINTSSKLDDFLKVLSPGKELGWGRTPTDTELRKVGWVDPIPYLTLLSSLRSVEEEEYVVAVVMVVDVSSSMSDRWKGGVKMDSARQAALGLLNLLEEEHAQPDRRYRVAVVKFESAASLVQPLTSDFLRLREAVTGLRADGQTNIGDGLEKASQQLDAADYDRAFVVLLSDGKTNQGRTPSEIVRWLEERVAPVALPVPAGLQASLYGADYKDGVNTTSNAVAARELLKKAGYQAEAYLNQSKGVALQNLPQDAVFFFGGHANSGVLGFLDEANNVSHLDSDVVRELVLGELFLAVLAGCKTAADVTSRDNILRAFIDAGARVGTGFDRAIDTKAANHWRYKFWETLVDGATVKEAALAGTGSGFFQTRSTRLSPEVVVAYPVHLAEQLRLVDLETLPARAVQEAMPPRVYTVGFGDPGDLDEELLLSIARITGGEYFYGDQADALENIFLKTQHQGTGNLLAEFEGTILQGQEMGAGRFTLPRGELELRVTLNWPGSHVDLRLYDPQGRLVDADYRGVKIWRTARPAYVVLERPRAGEWQVELYGREVPGEGTSYYVVASTSDIVAPETGTLESLLVLTALVLIGLIWGPRWLGLRAGMEGR